MSIEPTTPAPLERKLQRNVEIFHLLVNGVKDYAIFMLDPRGNIITWNEGAQRIKGYKADEIIGKHFSTFYTDDAKSAGHPEKALQVTTRNGSYEEEGWRVKKDGSKFWASVVISAIHEKGELIGFTKVTRDLTERRQAEQQREIDSRLLAQSNEELQRALQLKNLFLSTISHEVRTPMGGIIGMAELLTLKNLGEEENEMVRSIFDSSKRLLQLLNDMLDGARMESGKLQLEFRRFSLKAIIGDTIQLIKPQASKKELRVVELCDESVPEFLCGDEYRIRQILLNIAFNAVKFTSSGEIRISCSPKNVSGSVTIVRIAVADTGIGINQEDQQKLFEPFSQAGSSTPRLYGGTGLGLSISKGLVELMNGEIGVDSESGMGATFWFDIPFDAEKCLG